MSAKSFKYFSIRHSVFLLFLLFICFSSARPEDKDEEAEDQHEDICLLYARNDYTGEPLISLPTNAKIFETNLVFEVDEGQGINVEAIRLTRSNCSLILCNGKHLEGNCSRFTESSAVIPDEKVHKNVISVDCHCDSLVSVDNNKNNTFNEGTQRTLKRIRFSPVPSSLSSRIERNSGLSRSAVPSTVGLECANIFRDWHYEGQSQPLIFPGAAGEIDTGSEGARVRSVYVKEGCTAMLWGNRENSTLPQGADMKNHQSVDLSSFSTSTSFINTGSTTNYKWACCYCDDCSKTVCQNSFSTSASHRSSSELTKPHNDFSQFMKYGKKIIGIGRNYRWTKAELAPYLSVPSKPIVFLKPTTSYLKEGELIRLPQSLGTIYYELELGIVIGKHGKDVAESNALDHIAGYFLALDMTAKEFISASENRPWEVGKGFDTACPIGDFIPKNMIKDPNNVHLEATVNGKVTQSDNTKNMVFNVQQLIAYVTKYITLEPYDTILTGTPDGFGPMEDGDVITGRVNNISSIKFSAVVIPS